MEHIVFPKIRALGNEENTGILNGKVVVQEKIDGANLSVWKEEGGEGLYVGSRKNIVGTPTSLEGFRGAVEYVNESKGVKALLNAFPSARLYGERLISHTIGNYNIDAYSHFYLFDIFIDGKFLDAVEVNGLALEYGIKTPVIFEIYNNPTEEQVNKFVGESAIGPYGEGVVIKNSGFINKYGSPAYAKIVGEKFKETNNITFGNHQKGDVEIKLCNKYVTFGRVRKIINKIEQNEDRDVKMDDIKRIIGMTQHDIITEESWNIAKEGIINFRRFKGVIGKKTALIAISIINGEPESVAFSN